MTTTPTATGLDHLLRLNTKQAAAATNMHVDTIRRALEADDLHGTQRTVGGRWSIRRECLESWLDSEKCEHQKSPQQKLRAPNPPARSA